MKEISSSTLPPEEKVLELNELYDSIRKVEDDTLKSKLFLKLSYQFLKLGDSSNFKQINLKARNLSFKIRDSNNVAASFWDLGEFYYKQNILDSSYYYYGKSQHIYEAIGNYNYSGRLLLNIGIVQIDIRDYTGSEVTTVKAINHLKPLKEYKQLYAAYNNLGIIHKELEDYDKSLKYYKKALSYLSEAERQDLFPLVWNNIGVVYQKKGNYDRAKQFYKKALKDKDHICEVDKALCAKLVDNYAYTRLKSGDSTKVLQDLKAALEIRNFHKIAADKVISNLHLAEYFLKVETDTNKAKNFALRAKDLSTRTQNTRDLLSSLLFLAELKDDNALNYYNQYVKINDSLQKEERTIRNKFARIRFETDEYISETERLNQRVLIISFSAFVIFVILLLLYIIKDQRSRNKLITQKQYADQEIYNLILAQQKKYEEGREKEKQHISRELHDGILGKLFGVRLNLDSLNDEDTEESKNKRFAYIEELQKISEEIRLVSHKLNEGSIVDVDFTTVLQELVEKQNFATISLRLIFKGFINWKLIENNKKINIYRILQEAIYNVQKHSGATEGFVEFKKIQENILLEVKDNGTGFTHDESNEGIGLKNMQARARSINGTITFTSSGNGTIIELLVPIK